MWVIYINRSIPFIPSRFLKSFKLSSCDKMASMSIMTNSLSDQKVNRVTLLNGTPVVLAERTKKSESTTLVFILACIASGSHTLYSSDRQTADSSYTFYLVLRPTRHSSRVGKNDALKTLFYSF